MAEPLPDWQLPAGVTRGMWEYAHDRDLARGYDAALRDTPLLRTDERYVRRWCAPAGRLVDLGCGTGRVLVPLAGDGYRVLGVDLSEEMLRVAGEKAAAAGVAVERVKANLVCLDGIADNVFDYAICLFSTLGMVAGPDNRRRVVAHAYRLLRPGGRFVVHAHNRWFNARDPQGRRWLLRDLPRSLLGRPDAGDRDLPPHEGHAGFTLHLFTRREVVRLLRGVGFRLLDVSPVSLREDGRLPARWWLPSLRAYGYLIAAERPR